MKQNLRKEKGITLVALIITIIVLIILAAVTIKTVTDMKILEFAMKSTEDYSKAQDVEMEEFGKIENLLTYTISNIKSGNTDAVPSEPEEPVNNPFTEADIGKYVNYVPQGIDYTAEAKYSGHTASQVFNQDTNLKWKIWKVENDTLYIISDGVPSTSGYNNTGSLYLKNAQGYNNGVTLMDNVCQQNYGISGNSNVKVQNLKLDDVLAVKADRIANSSGNIYETQPYTYPPSGTFEFPSIWYNKERESLEVAQGNRSTKYSLVEEADSTTQASNQKPYLTTWYNNSMNNEGAWKSKEYYNMVISPAQGKTYWLSSRYASPYGPVNCNFGLQLVNSNGVDGYKMYYYNNGSPSVSGTSNNLLPLVSIPLKNCEITESSTTENTFDIVIK